MTTLTNKIESIVKGINPNSAEIILNKKADDVEMIGRFEAKGRVDIAENIVNEIKKYAEEFDNNFLTPTNVKVGDGVTMHMYSDSHAGTVVKVTKTTITVQQDKATLDPNFKPKMHAGGFAGHCSNQNEQTYTYEPNPNAEKVTFTWSQKRSGYYNKKRGLSLTKGRREFYDYNF